MKRELSEWMSNYPAPSSGISLRVRNIGTQTWFQSTFAIIQWQSRFEELLTYPEVLQALTCVKCVNGFLNKAKATKFLLNIHRNYWQTINVCEKFIVNLLKFIKKQHFQKLPGYPEIFITRLLNWTVKMPNFNVYWTSFPSISGEINGFR